MTHARVARSAAIASALTPARVLGSLLLGGALVFSAVQAVQAASPAAPAKAASAPAASPTCDDGVCPWHGGKHGHKGEHRKGARHDHGMKGGHGMGLPFAGPGFDRLLDDVQATDAQRKQIQGIADKARTDLRALHDKAHAQHQGAMAIWTSPKLDAAEAEKQRQQMLAHHDQVSKRMMQAMLDVGQVLTPEQRAKAAAVLQQRHERKQAHMKDRKERREDAREARGDRADREERLQNHKLRRPAPAPASAPAAASQPAPSR